MGLANWSELGYPDIDQEHQALRRTVDELRAVVQAGTTTDVPALLERLVAYSRFHFRSEESSMAAARYPNLEEHAAEHRKFIGRLDLLRYQL